MSTEPVDCISSSTTENDERMKAMNDEYGRTDIARACVDARTDSELLKEAAPDLLEAARALAALLPDPDRIDIEARDSISFEWQDVRLIAKQARAAIAKAQQGG